MKTLRIIFITIILIFILIQLVPNKLPQNSVENPQDIIVNNYVSEEISTIIRTSCYDCHSNQAKYPWYSHVAPSSWLVRKDIEQGRKALNFSEWSGYPERRMIGNLQDIQEETAAGGMPLPAYTLIHHKAKLNPEQKKIIAQWTDELSQKILQEK
jgi:hypothetical protein